MKIVPPDLVFRHFVIKMRPMQGIVTFFALPSAATARAQTVVFDCVVAAAAAGAAVDGFSASLTRVGSPPSG